MAHCISVAAGERLLRLAEHYELVWATGWEERANDTCRRSSACPELPVPHLRRPGAVRHRPLEARAARRVRGTGRWPGSTTPSTRAATTGRPGARRPTLLVPTEPDRGLEEAHVDALIAGSSAASSRAEPRTAASRLDCRARWRASGRSSSCGGPEDPASGCCSTSSGGRSARADARGGPGRRRRRPRVPPLAASRRARAAPAAGPTRPDARPLPDCPPGGRMRVTPRPAPAHAGSRGRGRG